MLDLRRIRQEPEEIKRLLAIKRVDAPIDEILALDKRRRAVQADIERLKAERNLASEEVSVKKKRGETASHLIAAMRRVGDEIRALEAGIGPLEDELQYLLMRVPNTPSLDVPPGMDAADNVEVRRFGDPPAMAFAARAHWDLGESLGIIDFERARKISGARFSVLKGWGARLSRGLIGFMLDHAVARGYVEMATPYLVNRNSMIGTGQFPKFEDDAFAVSPHDYFLIPTAEVPLTNLHRDEILSDQDLPLRYTAYTASFRAEAGAAGRDTRGLIRQHQFDKVELVRFVRPNESEAALLAMVQDAESVLEDLGLPYRTVLLCGGDMGFGQATMYDIEVWMPSYGRYVEISSCSNMTDFQARRADIRFRPEGAKKTEFVHTLNGSALAVGRTIAALLENYQTARGTVRVAPALQPYLNGATEITGDTPTGYQM
ncbi:MAG: serine--tRNA ligase [Thermaerobacter sp.]|nr:serine--tRNA ligase [Thermaerobacter sp.]